MNQLFNATQIAIGIIIILCIARIITIIRIWIEKVNFRKNLKPGVEVLAKIRDQLTYCRVYARTGNPNKVSLKTYKGQFFIVELSNIYKP